MSDEEITNAFVNTNPWFIATGIIIMGIAMTFVFSRLARAQELAFRVLAMVIGATVIASGLMLGLIDTFTDLASAVMLSVALGLLLSFVICFWPLFRKTNRRNHRKHPIRINDHRRRQRG